MTTEGRRLTPGQARGVELAIIALCVGSLVFIFQPWSLGLFGVGAGLVVLGGLAFNLVPFCESGTPRRALVRVAIIVATVLLVAIALAVGSAFAYVWYLKAR